ncbi:MAG: hypothetical protein HYV34_00830, partial [Candidatus Kerfeldbacteria bacterium]|nr:hypothetical protein [Candidatus Kerfeldbacteria bacterium]
MVATYMAQPPEKSTGYMQEGIEALHNTLQEVTGHPEKLAELQAMIRTLDVGSEVDVSAMLSDAPQGEG